MHSISPQRVITNIVGRINNSSAINLLKLQHWIASGS